MNKFICYNNEDICSIDKVKYTSLWQMVNQSLKNDYIYCMSSFHYKILEYNKRSMTVFKYLDITLLGPIHMLAFQKMIQARNSSFIIKNILKTIYHV